MAHADWKRYYAVVYDAQPIAFPAFFKHRIVAVRHFVSLKKSYRAGDPKPIGIVRVRGRKNNPQLQVWLKANSR